MRVDVNGTRLWFDVDGPELVPDGPTMRERPTVILIHGGPGGYDHSYFKPHFARLTRLAQVVYLDLRDHGRSARHDPSAWTFEVCADDVRAFADHLGIVRPVVLGHSMGGFVAMLYGARHPGHAGALVLQSTMARFDLDRLVGGFRSQGGDEVAELARRDFGGEQLTEADEDRVFAVYGPNVPDDDELERRTGDTTLDGPGLELMRRLDVVAQLATVASPTLVCVGDLDAVTPVGASSEILEALPAGVGRLEVIAGTGHFPWLDAPERYWPVIEDFVADACRPAV